MLNSEADVDPIKHEEAGIVRKSTVQIRVERNLEKEKTENKMKHRLQTSLELNPDYYAFTFLSCFSRLHLITIMWQSSLLIDKE